MVALILWECPAAIPGHAFFPAPIIAYILQRPSPANLSGPAIIRQKTYCQRQAQPLKRCAAKLRQIASITLNPHKEWLIAREEWGCRRWTNRKLCLYPLSGFPLMR